MAEVVATLSSFSKGSSREKQVFHCMVHNLFDEYQFFTKYPDKVIHTLQHARIHNHLCGTPCGFQILLRASDLYR